MRNKLIFGLLAIAFVFTSCSEDYYDSNFPSDAESGWIQFASANQRTTVNGPEQVTINVSFEVPVNRQDVVFVYTAELISGEANVATGEFSAVVPANTRDAAFLYDVDLDVEDAYEVRFTLVSVSNPKVMVGIGDDVPTSMVLEVAFPSIFTVGDWSTVTSGCGGNGSGGCSANPALNFEDLAYQVELSAGNVAAEFLISDITGGLYAVIYGDDDNEVTVVANFDTQVLSVTDQEDTTYGGDFFNGEGSYTLGADGLVDEFELSWSNGWGDSGETTFTL